jgi:cell division transport system ATP-binding protein
MLLFDNVTKKYNDKITALKDVHFNVDKGEFFFLIGPSGAGKTTLLRLLIKEEIPTSGSIFFDDIEVSKLPNKLLPNYRQRLGIVFQDIKLLQSKTLEENIAFALEILGRDDTEIKDTTNYLLETVGLKDRGNLFPAQLSGGEQQRGAIARALANNPEMLVADEPTGNLDPDNAFQILDILKKINNSGTTVMVISHDRDIVNQMKTRVIKIVNGEIVSDTKGDYDSFKEVKKTKHKKEEKKETFKDLNKDIQEIFEKAKIDNMDMVLNLTGEDLENLKFSKKQKESLEKYLSNYLNTK